MELIPYQKKREDDEKKEAYIVPMNFGYEIMRGQSLVCIFTVQGKAEKWICFKDNRWFHLRWIQITSWQKEIRDVNFPIYINVSWGPAR